VIGEFQFGPRPARGGGFEFRLWAPAAKSVDLLTDRATPMSASGHGWFRTTLAGARAGTRYKFRIDGQHEVPDPASAFQPDDVLGASQVIDHRYDWQAQAWSGRPWHEAVILELHVGTFTASGTFRAAIERLDDVAATGITAIELMPVADFFGRRNWGYDGVLWFAPDSAYGTPDDLRALIDAAHLRGLMVFLDVVYNHFGPEGNFLSQYAPAFFARDCQTPWGAAIDYEVPEVRAFAIENALHWLDRYRFDGLRLDAVHAIVKRGEPSILQEISKAAGHFAQSAGRFIHLVLESDDNDSDLLDPDTEIPNGKYRAQWNDDYHHAWHVLLTGEKTGYYEDYAQGALNDVAQALKSGFVYQGRTSRHRNGAERGKPSGHLKPTAFVSFLQNHDQIGNRAFGERLGSLSTPAAVEAALAVMLLAPMPPLLFMGDEWGEDHPFHFFCDFNGELANAVREGRRREFRAAYEAAKCDDVPDPLSPQVVSESTIDWDKRNRSPHSERHSLVRKLLACRAREVTPRLARLQDYAAAATVSGNVLTAWWRLDGGTLHLVANLADTSASTPGPVGRAIWNDMHGETLPPWSVFWTWET
jgi:maltooligosyltrehalose trehalohydrolase